MKITTEDRLKFLVDRLSVIEIGADWRGPRKRSYSDWGMRDFRHWRRWRIGDDVQRIRAIDAAIRAERQSAKKRRDEGKR